MQVIKELGKFTCYSLDYLYPNCGTLCTHLQSHIHKFIYPLSPRRLPQSFHAPIFKGHPSHLRCREKCTLPLSLTLTSLSLSPFLIVPREELKIRGLNLTSRSLSACCHICISHSHWKGVCLHQWNLRTWGIVGKLMVSPDLTSVEQLF